jgi:hypothetical protein
MKDDSWMKNRDDGSAPHDDVDRDERILLRREDGGTYLAIAQDLGLGRGSLAYAGYLRALRRRTPEDRDFLRQRELRRIDVLATNMVELSEVSDEERRGRLQAIEFMRRSLLDD